MVGGNRHHRHVLGRCCRALQRQSSLAHAGRVGKQVQPFGEAAQQINELAEACGEAQHALLVASRCWRRAVVSRSDTASRQAAQQLGLAALNAACGGVFPRGGEKIKIFLFVRKYVNTEIR